MLHSGFEQNGVRVRTCGLEIMFVREKIRVGIPAGGNLPQMSAEVFIRGFFQRHGCD